MKRTTHKKHIHIVGIKGVAMTALAIYLSERGIRVTGSDVPDTFPTDAALAAKHIEVYPGFDPERITKTHPDTVYYTGAHNGKENPEVMKAVELGIPSLPHGKALGEIMEGTRQIVVSGCHGKTTTSAMMAAIMQAAGTDASYAIGCGWISGLGQPGHYGLGSWFIAEGDEYVTDPKHDLTPRFMWLMPEVLLVTNIDFDHPDVYTDISHVQTTFAKLIAQSKSVVLNVDDQNSAPLMRDDTVTYGFSPRAMYRVTKAGVGTERMFFTLTERGVEVGEFTLKVPGLHNVVNAAGAAAAARLAGVSWDHIREGLLTFLGTKRRFEKLGEYSGVTYYDDYAHHPAEIRATLAAARQWYPNRRIVVVFQPHTYSRTKSLMPEFANSFADSDAVLLTDIYASAREHDTLGITGASLVAETKKSHREVYYAPDKSAVAKMLSEVAKSGSVVVFMGAGDIYMWANDIIAEYQKPNP